MAFIKLFKFQESTGLLKKEYEKGLRRAGRIWNILTIQSQTPEILKNSMNLYGSTMFAKDWTTSSISSVQMAMCEFAKKLTENPSKVNKKDIELLSSYNLSDKDISQIVQIIAYFNYINRVADGLGLEPEQFIDEKGYKTK